MQVAGERFGVLAAWWSQRNTVLYNGSWAILQNASCSNFGAVQMVTAQSTNGVDFGTGEIFTAVDLAINKSIRYFEIWNADLLNASLASWLQTTWNTIHNDSYSWCDNSNNNCRIFK